MRTIKVREKDWKLLKSLLKEETKEEALAEFLELIMTEDVSNYYFYDNLKNLIQTKNQLCGISHVLKFQKIYNKYKK